MAATTVVFHLVPRFSMIALFGALEPLRVANRFAPGSFAWRFTSQDGQAVAASNGIPVSSSARLEDVSGAGLVIVCASYDPEKPPRKPVSRVLHRLAAQRVPLGGIDTGPFFLGWAGVLDGFRATCHWESFDGFRESFPAVQAVQSLYELDRDRLTCAGGSSSIDMMLAWIGQRLGQEIAVTVADQLVHSRSADMRAMARMPPFARHGTRDVRLLKCIALMEEHTEEPLKAPELADAVGLSQRQLERLFQQQLGERLMAFYLRQRLLRAERLLSYSTLKVREIAVMTGFASLPQFSRAFARHAGKPPTAWREGASGRM